MLISDKKVEPISTNTIPANIGTGMKIGISSFGAWMRGEGSIIGSTACAYAKDLGRR